VTPEFDRLAADYEALLDDPVREAFAPGSEFFLTRKVAVIRDFAARRGIDRSRSTWLDVGCGTGALLRADRRSYAHVAGCDVSAGMLERCFDLETLRQTDPLRLPFRDAMADWVTLVCVLHHVAPADRCVLAAEIRRVLKPGGYLAVIEHNPFNPVVQLIVRRTPVDAHAQLLTAGSTRRLMRRSGFEPVDTRYFLLIPQNLYTRLAPVEAAVERLPFGGQYAVLAHRCD
jgi:ubiquinone/menaquinone biosynthesis C-methylase UbiE